MGFLFFDFLWLPRKFLVYPMVPHLSPAARAIFLRTRLVCLGPFLRCVPATLPAPESGSFLSHISGGIGIGKPWQTCLMQNMHQFLQNQFGSSHKAKSHFLWNLSPWSCMKLPGDSRFHLHLSARPRTWWDWWDHIGSPNIGSARLDMKKR